MRRVAELISVHDVLGLIGLGLVAWTVSLFDVRFVPLVLGAALILVAVAYARVPARRE